MTSKWNKWKVIRSTVVAQRALHEGGPMVQLVRELVRCDNGTHATRYILKHPYNGPKKVKRDEGMRAIESIRQESLF